MDRTTGLALSGDQHLAQSIADIITTPLGSRIMRRDYGSLLFELIDRPLNGATRLLCIMAAATALARWEPRIAIRQVLFEAGPDGGFAAGRASLTIIGNRTDDPDPNALTRLTIPIR
jgi:phage baseplate assembly protein W